MNGFFAGVLIGMGCLANLKLGAPLGPFIFSFGLIIVCSLNLELYTGRIGFFNTLKDLKLLGLMLLSNLVGAFCCGELISGCYPELIPIAIEKITPYINNWFVYFVQSFFCGIVMYVAVAAYKKGTYLGIIFGVPLFIFCGFQHCIANTFLIGFTAPHIELLDGLYLIGLGIVGNSFGSIFARSCSDR